jgi:hypothetical protein
VYFLKEIYSAHTKEEKLNKRMFFFWYKPEFRKKMELYLNKIGRRELAKALFNKK